MQLSQVQQSSWELPVRVQEEMCCGCVLLQLLSLGSVALDAPHMEIKAVQQFGTRHANGCWDKVIVALEDPKRGINK